MNYQAHTKDMTLTTHIKSSVLVLMVAALALVMVASQFITTFIVKALGDSKALRVAPATACKISADGTHFTGCSSIL